MRFEHTRNYTFCNNTKDFVFCDETLVVVIIERELTHSNAVDFEDAVLLKSYSRACQEQLRSLAVNESLVDHLVSTDSAMFDKFTRVA
jgi:hypothetical protein